jgi:hypothetical protein
LPAWEQDERTRYWTRFTEDTRFIILAAVRQGNFPSTAASIAGINEATFKKWRDHGRTDYENDEETDYAQFYVDLLVAEGQLEQRFVSPVTEAAEKDSKVAMNFLERRFPARWGPRARVAFDAESVAGNRVTIQAAYTTEEMSVILSALANAGKLELGIEEPPALAEGVELENDNLEDALTGDEDEGEDDDIAGSFDARYA